MRVGVDTRYAPAQLARRGGTPPRGRLGSRLRSKAALSLPPPRPAPRRGRPRVRGGTLTARHLSRRRWQRRRLPVGSSGKRGTGDADGGIVSPRRRLGTAGLRVVSFPQRSGPKMHSFLTPALRRTPARRRALYAARCKIEACFEDRKTVGGFADCRQPSFPALQRHAPLGVGADSLLRLRSVTRQGAPALAAAPWGGPTGPPRVPRVRRAVFQSLPVSTGLPSAPQMKENIAFKEAA